MSENRRRKRRLDRDHDGVQLAIRRQSAWDPTKLPPDVVRRLLSKHPPLELLPLRLVCKAWRDIIPTMHSSSSCHFLACHRSRIPRILVFYNDETRTWTRIRPAPLLIEDHSIKLLHSADGLLCMLLTNPRSTRFCVWNSMTNSFRDLHEPPQHAHLHDWAHVLNVESPTVNNFYCSLAFVRVYWSLDRTTFYVSIGAFSGSPRANNLEFRESLYNSDSDSWHVTKGNIPPDRVQGFMPLSKPKTTCTLWEGKEILQEWRETIPPQQGNAAQEQEPIITCALHVYERNDREWKQLCEMDDPPHEEIVKEGTLLECSGRLFLVGGRIDEEEGNLRTVEIWEADLQNKVWRRRAKMPRNLCSLYLGFDPHALKYVAGKNMIYVGVADGRVLKYSLENRTWTPFTDSTWAVIDIGCLHLSPNACNIANQ